MLSKGVHNNDDDDVWKESIIHPITCDYAVQVAGLGNSPGGHCHTCHARVIIRGGDDDDDDCERVSHEDRMDISKREGILIGDYEQDRNVVASTNNSNVSAPLVVSNLSLQTVIQGVIRAVWKYNGTSSTKTNHEDRPNQEEEEEKEAVLHRAMELIRLGSIWILANNQNSTEKKKTKSRRMTFEDATKLKMTSDQWRIAILRVHHDPCRCLQVYQLDWSRSYDNNNGMNGIDDDDVVVRKGGTQIRPPLPTHKTQEKKEYEELLDQEEQEKGGCSRGVIIHEDAKQGYAILYKRGGVPVHATVYNAIENVAYMYRSALIDRRTKRKLNNHHQPLLMDCKPANINDNSVVTQRNNTDNNDDGSDLNHGKRSEIDQDGGDEEEDDDVYVTLPQRLDNDTSGLLIVSTSKQFASYMSRSLQNKTERHLEEHASNNNKATPNGRIDDNANSTIVSQQPPVFGGGGITKKYKCLVCITSTSIETLHNLANSQEVVTHYVNSSTVLPRLYTQFPPEEEEQPHDGETTTKNNHNPTTTTIKSTNWLKCQLQIKNVGNIIPITPDRHAQLWGSSNNNNNNNNSHHEKHQIGGAISAVMEVEINLLTGRTHQIRGQLSALGFPLVGDTLYGSGRKSCIGLALHCYELSFMDPDALTVVRHTNKGKHKKNKKKKKKGLEKIVFVESDRRNLFRLSVCPWNEIIRDS